MVKIVILEGANPEEIDNLQAKLNAYKDSIGPVIVTPNHCAVIDIPRE